MTCNRYCFTAKVMQVMFLMVFLYGNVYSQSNHFPASGNVGVGTTSPDYQFHLSGPEGGRARFQFSNGRIDVVNYGSGSSAYSNSSGIFISGSDALFMGGLNRHLRFVSNNGIYQERMRITAAGNIGIGTQSPTHLLEVNGTIRAKEVKLEASNWPDYVFAADYQLLSLKETDNYIKAHGHLPGLKSAAEYEAEGVNMLELNQKLLEKVEQLTLYLLQQQEAIEDKDKRLEAIESKIASNILEK